MKIKSAMLLLLLKLPFASRSVMIVKAGLSLIFEVAGDIQKLARDLSCCSEANMLVLHQSSDRYTSKYEGKIFGPRPLMTALSSTN